MNEIIKNFTGVNSAVKQSLLIGLQYKNHNI